MKLNFRFKLGLMLFSLLLPQQAKAQVPYPSFADLAEKLIPSVVNISTIHAAEMENGEDAENFESSSPSIEHYFNQKGNNQVSLGSGFILSEDGYIITNNHVIDKAEEIDVILSDNTKIEAQLIGKDPKTDLALIKVKTNKKLTPIKFGDSDKIRVGDWILAIGNPFGLGGSVTAGIVSAKSRDIESGPYDNFIQTDASINQGSSGGPMFNMNGEVIGINSALFSNTGTSVGIGFAIPVNLAEWVINQLKEKGEVKRGWVGIKIQPNSEEIAISLGLKSNQGVVVSGLSENSSAQKAGLKAGDIILSFDGHSIDNTKNLSRLVAETKIGKNVEVEIWRNKVREKIIVLTEEMPEDVKVKKAPAPMADNPQVNESESIVSDLGIKVSELTPEIVDKFSLNTDTKGVIVTEIMPESDAIKKGLKVGDIIVKVDNKDVLEISNMANLVNEAKMENNRPVLLLLQSKGVIHFLALKLVSPERAK